MTSYNQSTVMQAKRLNRTLDPHDRRSQGAISPQLFRTYSHFVPWAAVSQAK